VVIKLLDQKGATDRLYARIAIALFLAQDLVVIVALTILSAFGEGESLSFIDLAKNLGIAFGGMVVLLSVALLAARYVLPKPFNWAARSPDTVFIWALCWCFLVVLLAHQFHLSVEIGAFLAGIAIAQLPIHGDLHRRLHPLMTFFIAIFLVTLGIKMELGEFGAIWPTALGLSCFVLLIKPLVIFTILTRMKFSEYTAFPLSFISPEMQATDIDVPFQFTILLRDVTERKKFEEELENLVEERTNQLDQARAEINVAQQIQRMLLPSPEELAAVEGLDIAAYMAPAAEVGGDYYDVLVHEGNVKIGIGDVTGHGLASGLVMLITQTAVRTLLSSHQVDSKRFLQALNHTIYNNVERMQVDKSLTLLLLDYHQQRNRRDNDTDDKNTDSNNTGGNNTDGNIGRVTLSGQHEEVLVVRKNGIVERINTLDLGFPLGLEASIEAFVAEHKVVLEPGDGIVLYTDGITEAENPAGEQFGLDRLEAVVGKNWQGSAQEVQDSVISQLNQYISTANIYDDVTLLVLKQL
jgi:serine phosphatase RsbU (regulator of sigma subunit)